MTTTVTAKIVPRQGTAAAWTSANPVLMFGERGLETDTGQVKVGDGVTAWTALAYAADEGAVTAHINSTANPHSVTAAQAGALEAGDDAATLGSGAADDGWILTADGAGGAAWEAAAAGGVTDHGALSGLADDDHTQYHTDTRGDARYSLLAHNHAGTYEPSGEVAAHAALTTVAHGISAFGATLIDDADAATARTTLGLGTAATTAATDYATAAQGSTADSAVQSDVTGITGADAITNIVSLTQAEYDALTPVATTLYVITE